MSILRTLAVRSFLEPYLPLTRLRHRLKFKKPKIKLVAVAKNESRYLAEWILHHLYFGIDHVEVHYNQCDDNTEALAEYLSKRYPVTFINADKEFAPHLKSPQVAVYRSALKSAYKTGYSHVLFLDVDEFLVPRNLQTSFQDIVNDKLNFDVISANWCNKLYDTENFGRALNSQLSIEISPTVKSMIRTFVNPLVMNPHNVISKNIRYGMTGQASFESNRDDKSKVTDHLVRFEQADAFVLHRQYRSELEYVALLGRGRPIEAAKKDSIFKNNRRGYNVHGNKSSLFFDEKNFNRYSAYLDEHLNDKELFRLHEEAEQMVLNRYENVVDMVANAPAGELKLLQRLLKNVELNAVNEALMKMKSNKKENCDL